MNNLPFIIYCKTGLLIYKKRALEFIRFDSRGASFPLFLFYYSQYLFYLSIGRPYKALIPASKIFRHTKLDTYRAIAINILKKHLKNNGAKEVGSNILKYCSIDEAVTKRLKETVGSTKIPFDNRLIILSSPNEHGKGVIVVKFTENFKHLISIFNMNRICNDYIFVLEPSFSGYFDEDILCLLGTSSSMIIESPEIIDYKFIDHLHVNLIPIELGASSWVDGHAFHPIKNANKIYDVVMVALWADFKRHYHLFEAISHSKNKEKLKIALVGVPWPNSIEDIKNQAKFYNVLNNIEFFENLPQNEVNALINKSKVSLLLSKKEGINKFIIESMHANVPAFVLKGFNYGYKYPFINRYTGGFINQNELSIFLDNIDIILADNDYSPYKWISKHMSAESSTEKLKNLLSQIEERDGMNINKDIVQKINNPDFNYKHSNDYEKFTLEYIGLSKYFK